MLDMTNNGREKTFFLPAVYATFISGKAEWGREGGGSTLGRQWAAKSEWAVHQDKRLHCTLLPHLWTTWMPSRPPARQNHTGFCVTVIELYAGAKEQTCLSCTKWSKVSGRPRASGFFPLQQRPYVLLSDIVKILHMDIYVTWDLWSIHAKYLSERQTAWSASKACLFSQDLIEGHTWETGVL